MAQYASYMPCVLISFHCTMGHSQVPKGVPNVCRVNLFKPFFSFQPWRPHEPEKVTKPVQGHFGADDNMAGFSDPAAAAQLAENLKAGTGACEPSYLPLRTVLLYSSHITFFIFVLWIARSALGAYPYCSQYMARSYNIMNWRVAR